MSALESSELKEAKQALKNEIAERRRAEEALRKSHDELELRVHERTAELEEANVELESNIEEQKLAEEKIREQAELLDKAQDAIGLRDLEHSIIYWNKGAQRLYGWTAEEVAGKNADKLLYRKEPPSLIEAKKSVLEKGEWMGELEQITKEGKGIFVQSRWTLIRDNYGKPKSILIINTDITERKKALQALQEARMYAESIVETLRESLIVLDADLRVKSANQTFYRTFKVTKEKTEGRFIYDLGNRQWDIPKLRTLLEEIIPRNTKFQDFEVVHEFQGIGRKTILLNARRIYHEGAGTQMILLAIEDITEKKKLESQLLHAQRMESIGTLAGGIAHDFNNMLTPIMLSLQMLKGKIKDEQSQQLLTILENNSRRSANLIKQVLSFSRGVEGERIPLQAKHIITEIEKIIKETFPRNIEIRTDTQKALFTVSGDATQLHQVIMNL